MLSLAMFSKLLKPILLLGLILSGLVLFLYKDTKPILIESLESKTVEGQPVFNRITFKKSDLKDTWLMEQSHHGVTAKASKWDKIAIVVDKTKTQPEAEFFQLAPGPEPISMKLQPVSFKISCFMCHSNGPRAIRPNFESDQVKISLWDRARLQLWNLRIKSYGPMASKGKGGKKHFRHPHPVANETLEVKSCTQCHNDKSLFGRNHLTKQNFMAIQFMLDGGHMPPPGFELSAEDKKRIYKFINL